MGLRPLEICFAFTAGDRLQSSESDVYRRLILTIEVDPCAVRVKPIIGQRRRWWTNIKSTLADILHKQITDNPALSSC